MTREIRVFPRRTQATPEDELAFVGPPPDGVLDADSVSVSCTFTWDRPKAEELAEAWGRRYSCVSLGGPAYDDPGDYFTPGRFLRYGYTITTRGCPNKCWFCFVPRREGGLRILPVMDGWDILDNNLLAAPQSHQERVFAMLKRQPKRPRFTGGLEAARLTSWFVDRLVETRLDILYLAYDRPAEAEPVQQAISLLKAAGFKRSKIGVYVLVGYAGDTLDLALQRVKWIKGQGATPFAMYYRNGESADKRPAEWGKFVRAWCRPAAIWAKPKLTMPRLSA
jgi:hypothetical protein